MAPREAIWSLEPHTKAKHELLRHYLGAWFPILSSSGRQRIVFLDGFAGPGIYKGGEPGSPIIALDVLLGHPHFARWGTEFVFLFLEPHTQRYASLLERTLARERHVYRHGHDALAAQEQPTDAVELYRRGERALQEHSPTDNAIRARLAQERYYSTWGYGDTPAPVRPDEPNEQPGWLIVTLGVLAAVLALVAGLAVLAAKRANRRAQVGQTT